MESAFEKPLLDFWGWVLVFPGWDCSLGFARLMDPKSWMLTIKELLRLLGALADEMFC